MKEPNNNEQSREVLRSCLRCGNLLQIKDCYIPNIPVCEPCLELCRTQQTREDNDTKGNEHFDALSLVIASFIAASVLLVSLLHYFVLQFFPELWSVAITVFLVFLGLCAAGAVVRFLNAQRPNQLKGQRLLAEYGGSDYLDKRNLSFQYAMLFCSGTTDFDVYEGLFVWNDHGAMLLCHKGVYLPLNFANVKTCEMPNAQTNNTKEPSLYLTKTPDQYSPFETLEIHFHSPKLADQSIAQFHNLLSNKRPT